MLKQSRDYWEKLLGAIFEMLSQLIYLFSRSQKQSRMFWSTGPIQIRVNSVSAHPNSLNLVEKKDKSFQSNTTNQPFCCLLQYAVDQTSFILLTLTHLCILQPESLKQWLKYTHTGSQIEITFLWDCSQGGQQMGERPEYFYLCEAHGDLWDTSLWI